MRGIDHLVHCVRHLEAARTRYSAMGFTLTPKALHPFGTSNSLIQLADKSFLEPLAVEDASLIPKPKKGFFSFADYNRRFIEDGPGEGLSMLVLDSVDSKADHKEYSKAGLDPYQHFGFKRLARLPSGEDVEVQFSMAFVTHTDMPRAAFFTCQQHHVPELFWKKDYQTHANTTQGMAETIMLANDPQKYAEFYSKLVGARVVEMSKGLMRVETARGSISVMSIGEWSRHFPASFAPDLPEGPRLAAFRLHTANLDVAAECLRAGNVPYIREGRDLVIAPDEALGVMVILSAA
ncbi:MAG: VOC family protein [Hyphomicrobiales bacterium]